MEFGNMVSVPDLPHNHDGSHGNCDFMYLVNSWLSNGVVAGGAEGYGGSVTWGNMSWFNQTYQYDRLNRLTSAQDTGWSRTFAHDEYGNMSVTSYNSGVPFNPLTPVDIGTNPYNAANNRLLSAGYDAGGNITQLGSITTTYDDEGHQTQTVDSSLHIQANYFYDPNGQRVQKTLASGSTLYVHDAFGNLAAEYNTAAATTPPCTTCYLSYDGLGSVRLVTDQNAAVVYRHDFLPFGEDIQAGTGGRGAQFGQSAGIHQEFTGQERDTENYPAVDYFNARYMSAVLGSFMSPDPGNAGADITNPQSWNAYAYVLGNPLGFTDPSGMTTGSPCENNSSCMSNIPGCIQNPQACAQTYFAVDPYQVWDPLQALTETIWVNDGTTMPQNTKADWFTSGATGVINYYPQSGNWQSVNAGNAVLSGDTSSFEGLDIWKGRQNLWSNTAGVGNAAAVGTLAVLNIPAVLESVTSTAAVSIALMGSTRVGQVGTYLFAQGNGATAKGVMNTGDYIRIGIGFNGSIGKEVFRASFGSKRTPLPNWVPGLVNGTLHVDFWQLK